MACYKPLTAYRNERGEVFFSELARNGSTQTIRLACGQCVGCRLERSRQWATRCLHEASLYPRNAFITLTYDDVNLPFDRGLHYDHFQKFMKRLRKRMGACRFYMCGEYGPQEGRPHFHACLFGVDFDDKTQWKKTSAGSFLYRSKTLEELWPFGFSSVGDVNFESAAYVARYIMKKITGDMAAIAYSYTDPETGEVKQVVSEFCHMSLKPGIGAAWLEKYQSDVFPHDYVIVRGKKVRPPKYYDRIFNRKDAYEMFLIKSDRELLGQSLRLDNTDARLAVKEKVAMARTNFYSRTVE